MLGRANRLVRRTATGYMADGALSHGAAIAYYTVFSLAPVLVILIAVIGLLYGHAAAQGAVVDKLRGLMGEQSATLVQSMIANVGNRGSGIVATLIGLGTLIVTASGVFGEVTGSLNIILPARVDEAAAVHLLRQRLASLVLVLVLAVLMVASLAASAVLAALGGVLTRALPIPGLHFLLQAANFLLSAALLAAMFAAIYKVLPDRKLSWREVGVGAAVTSVLFTLGKTAIGLYLGSSAVASGYGAAGGLVIVLLWIYYSAQIFLLGAEFTRAYAEELEGAADPQGAGQGAGQAGAGKAGAGKAGAGKAGAGQAGAGKGGTDKAGAGAAAASSTAGGAAQASASRGGPAVRPATGLGQGGLALAFDVAGALLLLRLLRGVRFRP